MRPKLDYIRAKALKLPEEERGALADDLYNSFLTTEEREIQAEWIEIAERRAEELRSGKVKGIPLDEVMRELRAKYRRGRRRTAPQR